MKRVTAVLAAERPPSQKVFIERAADRLMNIV